MSKISKNFLNYSSFLLVFSSMLFVLFEYLTHTNFIRNLFHISYAYFFFCSSFLFFAYWTIRYKKNILKKWKIFIFILPLFLITFALIIYMRRFFTFLALEREDGVIETLQTVLLFVSTLLCGYLSKFYWKKNNLFAILFFIASLGFFVLAGEEISWGQRIFNLETPEHLAEINTQGEINIHNNKLVWHYVYKGYALIGLVGSTAWILKEPLSKILPKKIKTVAKIFIPDWQYTLYFLTVFLYNLEAHILNPRTGSKTGNLHWEEPMELLLFLGITLFLFEIYMRKKQYVKNEL